MAWRASLENAQTGEQMDFASLDRLSSFLHERTGSQTEAAGKDSPDYLSYLLRLWQVDGGEGLEPVWRASLQSTHSKECKTFASLDDLFEFLSEATNSPPNAWLHSTIDPTNSTKQGGGRSNNEDLD